jgi:pimeloyl-ACP methyl ester carboxylesterase
MPSQTLEVLEELPSTPPRHRPILFVHGAWHAAWCWAEHFLPYFAGRGYPAVALSLRGHGQSAGHAGIRGYRLMDYVADVATVAARWSDPPIIIGHSMGGWIVQKYLEHYSAPAVVLLAPMSCAGIRQTTLRSAMRFPPAWLRLILTGQITNRQMAHFSFWLADMPMAQVDAYYRRLEPESLQVIPDSCQIPLGTPCDPLPILVLGAADDMIFTPESIQTIAQRYQIRAEILPNTAHDMMLGAGWQRVANRIAAWLEALDMG